MEVRWSGLRDGASKPNTSKTQGTACLPEAGARKFTCICLGSLEACARRAPPAPQRCSQRYRYQTSLPLF
jgi:hypothetical protein